MKILLVNTLDINGGAARAAYRLHQALLSSGQDSQMLVQYKASDDHTVIRLDSSLQKTRAKISPILDAYPLKRYPNRTMTPFSPAWIPFSGVPEAINTLKPDIVHLHWICGGMMRIEDIAKIKAPIVWSLHDMWAFTGGCHYDEACGGYKQDCRSCKVLNTPKTNPLSTQIFKRKQASFDKIRECLTIVGLSQWLADCAANSTLFKNTRVVNLPNPIDGETFSPMDKHTARTLLHLPQDKKLVLFGAMSATADPRKGFKELSQALTYLPAEYELVVFGSSQPKTAQGFKQRTHYLGQLHDNITLRLLYSAADVMIVPSLQENLSNAIMESLACGTPVVAFAIGGNSDMIDHHHNGYLAKPYEPQDLAAGIRWVLETADAAQLSNNARQTVLSRFDSDLMANRYIGLYQKILNQSVFAQSFL